MLSACRESRDLALKALKPSRIIFSQIGRPLYFNDEIDTLKLIDSMQFIGNTRYGPFRTDLSTIENLVVVCRHYDWTVFRHRGFDVEHAFHCFKRFHKLKKLTLVGIPVMDVADLKSSAGSVFHLDAVKDTLEMTWEWFNGTNRFSPVAQVSDFIRPQLTVISEVIREFIPSKILANSIKYRTHWLMKHPSCYPEILLPPQFMILGISLMTCFLVATELFKEFLRLSALSLLFKLLRIFRKIVPVLRCKAKCYAYHNYVPLLI